MPRPLRSRFPYGWYHVYARGVEGRSIFADDQDHRAYERNLVEVERRHGWRVHCAVHMPNHVHLIVETGQPGLSRGMQLLHGRHAQRFNLRHGRVGHLFQSRFAAKPIRDDRQLRTTMLYVLWNPVRAGLADQPRSSVAQHAVPDRAGRVGAPGGASRPSRSRYSRASSASSTNRIAWSREAKR